MQASEALRPHTREAVMKASSDEEVIEAFLRGGAATGLYELLVAEDGALYANKEWAPLAKRDGEHRLLVRAGRVAPMVERQRALLGRMLDLKGWLCSGELRRVRGVSYEAWVHTRPAE